MTGNQVAGYTQQVVTIHGGGHIPMGSRGDEALAPATP